MSPLYTNLDDAIEEPIKMQKLEITNYNYSLQVHKKEQVVGSYPTSISLFSTTIVKRVV